MRHLTKSLLMLSFAAASLSAGPAQAQSGNLDLGVTISSGMPPPRVVYSAPPPPLPPRVQRIWVDGYWGWSRGFSVWVPGHWEAAQLRYGQPGWRRNDQGFRHEHEWHERHEHDHHDDHEGRRGDEHDGRRAEDRGHRH